MSVRIVTGDCRDRLAEMPPESVHCIVTSPPYFGLRDYGVAGQIGLEPSPEEFVRELVDVFREARRVLRADGTLWLNLGDSYAANVGGIGNNPSSKSTLTTNGGKGPKPGDKYSAESRGTPVRLRHGCKPKDLLGIPWAVARALRDPYYTGRIKNERDRAWLAGLVDGEGCVTILESASPHGSGASYPPILQVRMCDPECVYHAARITGYGKASPEQEPPSQGGQRGIYQWRLSGRKATDTLAEIFPYLLIKRRQAIVAWNHQAVRDGYETKRGVKIPADALEKQQLCRDLIQRLNKREAIDLPSWMVEPPSPVQPGYYLRSNVIWAKPNPMPESVTDRPTSAHEHVFLLAKSERYYYDHEAVREGDQITFRKGTEGGHKLVREGGHFEKPNGTAAGFSRDITVVGRNLRNVWTVATEPFSEAHFATFPPSLIEPCIKAGCPVGGTVLDPFGGAGTTGLVADRLGRNAVLIELNPQYADMARRRIQGDAGMFASLEVA